MEEDEEGDGDGLSQCVKVRGSIYVCNRWVQKIDEQTEKEDRKDETERSERSDRQIRSDGWMYALVFERWIRELDDDDYNDTNTPRDM